MPTIPEIKPEQSIELLKELHILTRDGKLNQDSRRKLKQVYHLYHFIEPLLAELLADNDDIALADHGAGKSYLGFILYDLFFKGKAGGRIFGIETRPELVEKSRELAHRLGFARMEFLNLTVEESITSPALPEQVDIVTALHACDTATDDAIRFALYKQAKFIVLVPLPGRDRRRAAQEQERVVLEDAAFRALAPPDPHARVRQPADQRPALPDARSARLPGDRY